MWATDPGEKTNRNGRTVNQSIEPGIEVLRLTENAQTAVWVAASQSRFPVYETSRACATARCG
jgi:hypothetical protein